MDTGVYCQVCHAEVDRDWDVIADQIVCITCTHEHTEEELEERFQEQNAWRRAKE